MVAKHTPGPWETFDNALNTGVYSPKGGADVAHCRGFSKGNRHHEEEVANARLMAAAPDLLEALKDCTDRFVEAFPAAAEYEPIVKARAAIAKAEGQS